MWLEWKGRKATAMYNQHRLLGRHWQEEGEVGDLEQETSQPLNGESEGQVGFCLSAPVACMWTPQDEAQADQHASCHTGDRDVLVRLRGSACYGYQGS